MCGINGLVNFDSAKPLIERMNQVLAHRGPDAEGVWQGEGIALGHRRLSIIDLSDAANQPLEKDGLVIVYNGEVYNYRALREELRSDGIVFKTQSDTEVVLELFRRDREESFNKLVGMFAFCVYDTRTKDVFLVRDHFGIKPLFYAQLPHGKCAFSSEMKSLMHVSGIDRNINPRALAASLNYLWIDGDASMFAGIHKLPAAHYMHIQCNNNINLDPLPTGQAGGSESGMTSEISVRRYWQLSGDVYSLSENDLAEKLHDVLDQSVKRHLVSDVPVGAFLSGGLDSSLITAMAKKYNSDLSTYTISIDQRDKHVECMPDDNMYAKQVAAFLGVKHTDIAVDANILDSLEKMVYALDEPIGDPAAINTYLICKLARENGIKVLLSGMGADELFGGYRRQYATLLARQFGFLPFGLGKNLMAHVPVRVGGVGLKTVRWAKRFLSFAGLPLADAYMRSYSYYDRHELVGLLGDAGVDDMYGAHRNIFSERSNYDAVNQMCYTDMHMFMQGLNLTYTDRAAMAASVEVRVPFIDKEVVECAMAIAGRFKIRGKEQKYILKRVAERYLPKDIVHRKKASFGMPIRAWISRDLRPVIDDILSFESVKRRGLLNPKMVRKIIEDDRKGKDDNAYKIYQFLTLELWARKYLGN